MIPQTSINVYDSDFADFPGLAARLENFLRGPRPCLRVLRKTATFITVAGSDILIHALYHPHDGYPGK